MSTNDKKFMAHTHTPVFKLLWSHRLANSVIANSSGRDDPQLDNLYAMMGAGPSEHPVPSRAMHTLNLHDPHNIHG